MEITSYLNTSITVIITMIVTIIVKAIIDWGSNKNGKTAIGELTTELKLLKADYSQFKNESLNLSIKIGEFLTKFKTFEEDYQKFKMDDLMFKNKFLQDLSVFKYEFVGKKEFDNHISLCGLKVEENKDCMYEIKQELAMLTQRVGSIEK